MIHPDYYIEGFNDGKAASPSRPPFYRPLNDVHDYERGYHDGAWEES